MIVTLCNSSFTFLGSLSNFALNRLNVTQIIFVDISGFDSDIREQYLRLHWSPRQCINNIWVKAYLLSCSQNSKWLGGLYYKVSRIRNLRKIEISLKIGQIATNFWPKTIGVWALHLGRTPKKRFGFSVSILEKMSFQSKNRPECRSRTSATKLYCNREFFYAAKS